MRVQPVRLNELYSAPQGEGPYLGRPSVFVRLQNCPVGCSWCDTKMTWDGSETGESVDVNVLAARIQAEALRSKSRNLVITGGEPLVHRRALALLLPLVASAFESIEIETAGVISPDALRLSLGSGKVRFNLSPKLPSAEPKMQPNAQTLAAYQRIAGAGSIRWKFVVSDAADIAAMTELIQSIPWDVRPVPEQIWLMPCTQPGLPIAPALAWVIAQAEGTGYNVTTRMHFTAFGPERGR